MERVSGSEISFTSDMTRAYVVLAKLGVAGIVLMPLAAAIGQYRTDRFPVYSDIGAAVLIVVGLIVFGAILFFVGGKFYKVYIGPSYVYCYTTTLTYKLVTWPEMQDIVLMKYYGLHYLYVYQSDSKNPITIPLWLRDMSKFRDLVRINAGADHSLTIYLENYAT